MVGFHIVISVVMIIWLILMFIVILKDPSFLLLYFLLCCVMAVACIASGQECALYREYFEETHLLEKRDDRYVTYIPDAHSYYYAYASDHGPCELFVTRGIIVNCYMEKMVTDPYLVIWRESYSSTLNYDFHLTEETQLLTTTVSELVFAN